MDGRDMDLNCDMGESFGAYALGQDAVVMPFITSANIACGYHAGDPLVMAASVALAAQHGVAVGAHPGHPDLQGFGRRSMDLTPEEVEALTLYQIGALAGFTRAAGVELVHVKPHGALYNQAAKDIALARAIARAVAKFSAQLILVGLAGSALVTAGEEAHLHTASEGFPDRAYNPDGSLRSRKLPGAVLEDPAEVLAHALELAARGIKVESGSQTRYIAVDTLCLHGDHAHSGENARKVRGALEAAGIAVARLGK
jgi:5-oxoprolinase (ATP-hydrolysing) subunit A